MRFIMTILAFAAFSAPAAADDVSDCEQDANPELGIAACTAVIAEREQNGGLVAWAYYNRAIDHTALGNLEAAVADYDAAIRADPEFGDAYHNRGVAYESLGDFIAAIGDWEKAIELQGAERIRWWQEWTRHNGSYEGPLDGVYSDATRAAVHDCASDPAC